MKHYYVFFSSRRRHTRSDRDWSSDVCSSDLGTVTICLRRRLPDASSDRYPRARRATVNALLFGLAPGGVCLVGRSPGRRWALTPPFHPYPTASLRRQTPPGGVISVALSFGSPRLGVTQRPALRSPDFPPTVFTYVGGHPSASAHANSTHPPWAS